MSVAGIAVLLLLLLAIGHASFQTTPAGYPPGFEVQKLLLATGDPILTPGHYQKPNAPDAWRYDEIRVRAERRP